LNDEVVVGIAEYRLVRGPGRLTTIGLGSCIGVVMYDKAQSIACLGHFMLPDSKSGKSAATPKPGKYADTCIEGMLRELTAAGCRRSSLIAKAAGAASMFKRLSSSPIMDISSRNIESLRKELSQHGIALVAEDLGGEKGRTITFDVSTGKLTVKTVDPSNLDSGRYLIRTI